MELKKKIYTLYEIRQFYNDLFKSGLISDDILDKIILYGGTLPYLLSDEKEAPRKFGDVDMYMSSQDIGRLRKELENKLYFEMTSDSKELNLNCIKEEYGFRGKLFGVDISVFPIYKSRVNNQENKQESEDTFYSFSPINSTYTEIREHSFREWDEDGDKNEELYDTIVLKNSSLSRFARHFKVSENGTIYVPKTKMVPLEFTVATKELAIQNEYTYRNRKKI